MWRNIKLPKSASQVLCSITYPTLPQSSSMCVPDSEACVQRSVLLRLKHGPSQVSTPEAATGVLYTALQGWFVYWMHSMPADTNLLIYLSCNGRFAWVCVCVCVCVYVFSMLGQVCMCWACTCTHVYDIQICTFQSYVVEIRADRYAFISTQLLQRPMSCTMF